LHALRGDLFGLVLLEALELGNDRAPAGTEARRDDEDCAHGDDGRAGDEEQVIRHIALPFAGDRETPARLGQRFATARRSTTSAATISAISQ